MYTFLILLFALFSVAEPEMVEMSMYVENTDGNYLKISSKSIPLVADNEANGMFLEEVFAEELLNSNTKYFITKSSVFASTSNYDVITQEQLMNVLKCCYGINLRETSTYCYEPGVCLRNSRFKVCRGDGFSDIDGGPVYMSCGDF